MDFTFVVNGEHESRKRKTIQGACEPCKKRKKRCTHHRTQSHSDTRSRSKSPQVTHPLDAEKRHIEEPHESSFLAGRTGGRKGLRGEVHAAAHKYRCASTPPPTTRFVGDLNPEASMIVDAQTERAPSRDRHSLGIWLDQENSHDQRVPTAEHILKIGEDHAPPRAHTTHTAGLLPDLKPLLPAHSDQLALVDVYFSRLHPVLPILDEDQFRREFTNGTVSVTLLQVLCLVIAKDVAARSLLSLEGLTPSPLTPSRFCSLLYDQIVESLARRRERNRIHLIQTLALLSFHTDSGPYGVEDASMHLAQAIHHAQTVGLHLGRANGHRKTYDKLFWSLWCLSILTAASNGRPRSMSDQDIGLKIDDILEACHPAFRVNIALSQLLARVIRLYQPMSDPEINGLDIDFPSFEIIVEMNGGWDIDVSILTSLELFYHAVAILSYRTRSTDDVELAPPSSSSLRQALSAQQVMRILNHTQPKALLPFPTISYAISLALSQTYRQFRRSRFTIRRDIAQEQLECYVKALEELSGDFTSAMTMAAIGRKVLSQIERLNEVAARQVAGPVRNQDVDTAAQGGTSLHIDSSTVPDNGSASTLVTDQHENAQHFQSNMDTFSGFDGLFSDDGTLQAMDTVFDNFMGLDVPNEVFNACIADDAFGFDFEASQPQ